VTLKLLKCEVSMCSYFIQNVITGSVENAVQVKCSDSQWDVEVDMNILQAKYPAIKPVDIFFGEPKCQGKLEGSLLKFQYDFNSCKTADMVRVFHVMKYLILNYMYFFVLYSGARLLFLYD
jgi:hypothetical protein